eukprot:TRINITY_DN50711_c0_g1_i1.p1 TRINITY_DN50711_c0_g1~~TRINITY_DN50711_c0_g1_i1.p1  ORF type:complete len:445 (+),score=72.69 TRINITY_DN50711_c0_g1_i1:35-1336(+)
MPVLPKNPGGRWDIPPRYKVSEIIGSGSYGSVCQARDEGVKDEPRNVAIKKCKRLFEELTDCKRILREICILGKIRHQNVVQALDFHIPGEERKFNEIYMVMELCDTDLKKLCKQDVVLSLAHVNTLLWGMLAGLKYIHSAGIYHRDLKPANCFVNQDCTVKIGDFGLSRAIGGEANHLGHHPHTPRSEERTPQVAHTKRAKKNLTRHVVTRWYRAPELILLSDHYNEAIDVWSLGCIYAELLGMLEGKNYMDRGPLFPGQSCFPLSPRREDHTRSYKNYTAGKHDMIRKIFGLLGTPSDEDVKACTNNEDARRYISGFGDASGAGLRSVFPEADKATMDILQRMLIFSPKRRISVKEALAHPLLVDVRNEAAETTASGVVVLKFEAEPELNEKLLRKYFWDEVHKFHLRGPSLGEASPRHEADSCFAACAIS